MGLVDYSSSSDSDSDKEAPLAVAEPPSKRRRTSGKTATAPAGTIAGPSPGPDVPSALPPLPSAFHDLYASTVRPSPGDDPSLHQGRRRQIPHVAGQWPSHVYVEWHPPPAAHALLRALLAALDAELASSPPAVELSTFLTSDLGAPLPLHVSLSRPFVLRTDERGPFLEQLTAAARASGVAPFELRAAELAWHRSPDSNRSFLVLRVRSRSTRRGRGTGDGCSSGGQDESEAEKTAGPAAAVPRNRELTALLDRCNRLVASYGQPTLYQQKSGAAAGGGGGGDSGPARDAFHISVAWSFAEPTAELRERTAAVFARDEFRDAIAEIPVSVDSIKVKIGNVVTNVTLKGSSTVGDKSRQRKGLFGV